MSSYFKNIKEAVSTLSSGLKLTLRYLTEARFSRKPIGIEDESYFEVDKGIVTLQYPYESLPVPDNARYRLHNEIDDCIVCDKCAKVCPVDCIDIEAIRSPETFGVTSDGTPKRIHAAKFDIDMGKCCFCGLCTTVCPTECLTMTKVYDFSEFDINDHVYSFADMSLADIAQKRKELEAFEAKKAAEKEAKTQSEVTAKPKPSVRPKPVKPASGSKPAMKPKLGKPVMKPKTQSSDSAESKSSPRPKPVMKPKVKPKTEAESSEQKASKPKPVMKPKVKPKSESEEEKKAAKPRPVMKPKIKPKSEQKADENKEDKPKPKYRPRPVIRKKPKDGDDNS